MRQFLSVILIAALNFGPLTTANAGDIGKTATPIKHVVVIFQENVSFDHYFGTYPSATNPHGEPYFKAFAGTPDINGLTNTLLTNNPNLNAANGTEMGRASCRQ